MTLTSELGAGYLLVHHSSSSASVHAGDWGTTVRLMHEAAQAVIEDRGTL